MELVNLDLKIAQDLCVSNPEKAYIEAESVFHTINSKTHEFESYEAKMIMAHAGQFLGMHARSYQMASECLNFFENVKADFHIGYVLNTLGFIYNYFDDHENRLIVNLRSLDLREKTGDQDGFCRSLNNTGDTFIKLGKYKQAQDYLEKCLEITPKVNTRLRCVALSNLGEAYFYLCENEKSISHFEECIILCETINFIDIIFNCQLHLGIIKLNEHQYLESKLYFDKASEKLKELPESIENQAHFHKSIATFYEVLKDYDKAIFHLKRYYTIENEIKTQKQKKEIKSIQHSFKIEELENLVYERTIKLEETSKDLRTQEIFNRKILNSARHGIVVFDRHGVIKEYNPFANDLLSIEMGSNIFDYLIFRDKGSHEKFIDQLFSNLEEDQINFKFEMTSSKKDDDLTLDVSFTLVDDNFEKRGIAFINDITYRVQAEKERTKELETEITINFFAQSLFNANSVSDVLWGLAKDCISNLGFQDCVIYLLDEQRNELVQMAAYGPKNPIDFDIHNPITIPIGKGIVGSVAKTGIAEIINDTSSDSRYILDDDMRLSEIAVPIKLGEKVIGVIDSEHPHKHFYNERHLRVLSTISKLAANRIDKLREQEAKEKLQLEILKINESLEAQVLLKTNENIQLNKEIAEKEKSLLMGEMSSLLAHELNTPLANIQNASNALIETIQKKSPFAEDNSEYKFSSIIRDRLISSVKEPSRLISSRTFKLEESIANKIIKRNELFNLKDSVPEIVRLNLVDEKILLVLNEINHVQSLLKSACYEKNIATFLKILKVGVDEISRVVDEVKSLKSFDSKLEKQKIILSQSIIGSLKHHFHAMEINFLEKEEKLIQIICHPDKLTQLWFGLFKITDEHVQLNKNFPIELTIFKPEKFIDVKIKIPVFSVDLNFFNQSIDFNSFTDIDRSLRVRLSIIKTILEEHHAKLTFENSESHLVFKIEFDEFQLNVTEID